MEKSVLIVEDDEAIEFALADLATDYGYRTYAARDGIEALEVLRRERPLVIIMDLIMPRMDGYTLLGALRSNEDLARIPVLVVTASLKLDQAALAGVQVFRKPLDSEALIAAILAHDPFAPGLGTAG